MTTSIALVGLSGVGKSTVGHELAARTRLPLLDTDALIVQETGQSVAALFAAHGEAYFRNLETAALRKALERSPAIIATGGGIVLDSANRVLLREHCQVLWLDAPTALLVARLRAHDEERPLLTSDDLHSRLEHLRVARAPLYAEVAHIQIDTSRQSMQQIADAVLEGLWARG